MLNDNISLKETESNQQIRVDRCRARVLEMINTMDQNQQDAGSQVVIVAHCMILTAMTGLWTENCEFKGIDYLM